MPGILYNHPKLAYTDKCLYYYRQNNGSIIHNVSTKRVHVFTEAAIRSFGFYDSIHEDEILLNGLIHFYYWYEDLHAYKYPIEICTQRRRYCVNRKNLKGQIRYMANKVIKGNNISAKRKIRYKLAGTSICLYTKIACIRTKICGNK